VHRARDPTARRRGRRQAIMSDISPAFARILVVDDHPIVRLGMRQMLAAEGFMVCAEADSVRDAIDFATAFAPDLALVDLSLEDGSGLELIRTLRLSAPRTRLLVISIHDEVLFAERVLRAGAHGYIMKQQAIHGLVHAVREVLAGRLFVSPNIAQHLLGRLAGDQPANADLLGGLTDRELEIFELIGRGLNTASIAERLNVSVKTVETHRGNIKTKLDLKDATDLIRLAATWTEHV
jgi:DNA-binding NarL/FixJ family response regulator